MWMPLRSRLPVVLTLLVGCAAGGFGLGYVRALHREGPPVAGPAAAQTTSAVPATDAVPLGAPLIEEEKADKPKDEVKETEVAQEPVAPPPAPEAPPPAKPAAPADPIGDVLQNAPLPPDVPY